MMPEEQAEEYGGCHRAVSNGRHPAPSIHSVK